MRGPILFLPLLVVFANGQSLRSNEGKWQDSFDLETVFHEERSLAELEALDVERLLKANGIASQAYPNSLMLLSTPYPL